MGRARRCPPRRSGRPRRAAAWSSTAYVWGTEPEPAGERLANYWHGEFPWRAEPGYGHTAPVGSFPATRYGLFDMAGNVWEWTTDWYAIGPRRGAGPGSLLRRRATRAGRRSSSSYDPRQPQFRVPRRVIKGGSFLCADSYCQRYRPAARRPQMIDTGMSHIGFRCVRGAAAPTGRELDVTVVSS